MTTIEDELRAVLADYGSLPEPPINRSSQVANRIARHRQAQLHATLAAVLVVILATGGAVVLTRSGGVPDRRPEPAASTALAFGHLPQYLSGGHLLASATAEMPAQTTLTLTFTPTSWDMRIGSSCAAPTTQWMVIKLNGHGFEGASCLPDAGPAADGPGEFDEHQVAWEDEGVRLGEPSTLTVSVGLPMHDPVEVVPNSAAGVMTVGVYMPVAWDAYPFPPKPSPLEDFEGRGGLLPHHQVVATVTGGASTSAGRQITLPKKIELTASAIAPGQVRIWIDKVQIDEFDSWDWQNGYSGSVLTVGSGRLAAFHPGQKVTLTIKTDHFPIAGGWRVILLGT